MRSANSFPLESLARKVRELQTLPASKAEAKKQGVRKYFTGVACNKGHISPRYTSNGECAQCSKQRTDRYLSRKINAADRTTPTRHKLDDLKFERELRALERGQ